MTPGFDKTFRGDALTLGLFYPIDNARYLMPNLSRQVELTQLAEALGFAAVWARDIPLRDPGFGDVGQVMDVWTWLAFISAHTSEIALATGSHIITLRHPIDSAKAAASIDNLSNGRLLLGVAGGDRPSEFPAYGRDIAQKSLLFQQSLQMIRDLLDPGLTDVTSPLGELRNIDLVPKPKYEKIPIFGTGQAGQTLDWLASHTDGWITFPRPPAAQAQVVRDWSEANQKLGRRGSPVVQSLYLDLLDDPLAEMTPIHLGVRSGSKALLTLLNAYKRSGIAHVALNLRYSKRPVDEVLHELGESILPFLSADTFDDG